MRIVAVMVLVLLALVGGGCGSDEAVSPTASAVAASPSQIAASPAPHVVLTADEQRVVDFIAVKLPTLHRILSLQDDVLELGANGQYSAMVDKMRRAAMLYAGTADEWRQFEYAGGRVATEEALFERALDGLSVNGKVLGSTLRGTASDNDIYRAIRSYDRAKKAIKTLEVKIDRLKSSSSTATEL
jgi:hypothetical protein